MKFDLSRSVWPLTVLLTTFGLGACSSDRTDTMLPPPPPPPPPTASFEIVVSNLTNAQPLSPVAIIAHQDGFAVFEVGMPATGGLEELAEGGDNAALLAEADSDVAVIETASGAAPIGPAGSETLSIEVLQSDLPGLSMSVTTMLVNTNDAITVLNGHSVEDLQPGDVMTVRTIAYDAGTEANTEQAAHIPGPAGGGEGFNAARDDIADRVAMHVGVVSGDDGFPGSGLTGQHKFDNAVMQVRIERIN